VNVTSKILNRAFRASKRWRCSPLDGQVTKPGGSKYSGFGENDAAAECSMPWSTGGSRRSRSVESTVIMQVPGFEARSAIDREGEHVAQVVRSRRVNNSLGNGGLVIKQR